MFNLQPFILICKLILTTLTLYNHHLYMTIVHACVGSRSLFLDIELATGCK